MNESKNQPGRDTGGEKRPGENGQKEEGREREEGERWGMKVKEVKKE